MTKCEQDWKDCNNQTLAEACTCLADYDECLLKVCNTDETFIDANCVELQCSWCHASLQLYIDFALVGGMILAFCITCICLTCYMYRLKKKEDIRENYVEI